MDHETTHGRDIASMWRSLEEAQTSRFEGNAPTGEFGFGASDWMPGMDRRDFLRIMGASLAMGGLSGCIRPSGDKLVPYVTPPEDAPLEDPTFYATAMPVEGFARGIVVETHFGRPTKIEGNPDHPEVRGTSDAVTQASILGLYDPDRSRTVLHDGRASDWISFESEWQAQRSLLAASGGAGLAFLTEPTTSTTLLREIGLVLEAYPRARWYQHTPLAVYAADGLQVDYDLGGAAVILSLGSDFLSRHPASLRYAREFADARRQGGGTGPRLYVIEASPTPTGSTADARLPASPDRMRAVLNVVAAMIGGESASETTTLSDAERRFVEALVSDLRANSSRVACIAGAEQGADIHAWANAMNVRLGAVGSAVSYRSPVRSDHDVRSTGGAKELASAIGSGSVQALIVLSSNPTYTAPGWAGEGLLSKVPLTVHLGSHADETSRSSSWHLPEAHYLETWGDLRSFDGTGSIQQPVIEPLFGGRSAAEVLHFIRTGVHVPGYELVRGTWTTNAGGAFEQWWASALKRGYFEDLTKNADGQGAPLSPRASEVGRLEVLPGLCLVVAPDPTVGDGRWANNAWLQELPKPPTQLVWDNAALVSPSFASRLGISNGDVLLLSVGGMQTEAAAWILPGQAPETVSLSLGYGRTAAGSVGDGRGFNAYLLRPRPSAWEIQGLDVKRTGKTYALVSTQRHFSMEGRNPVRTKGEKGGSAAPDPKTSLYPDWKPGVYSWGMSIDLGSCTGCNACVVACQSENNIPVVGKLQVAREREMHWIRIDRYFDGGVDDPRILSQPVTCMHCEKAPCEVVCPVGATVHNDEGLNEMVYNRCVGTRYCSNNCPYKVRRFNFLDYKAKAESPETLQQNPQVTVRDRGVMEKCTYCVQRINTARIRASKENRAIRDGEILTACQQACPTQAIVFGNIADPSSVVASRKASPDSYSLLGELNTRPRTTYLSRHAGMTGA